MRKIIKMFSLFLISFLFFDIALVKADEELDKEFEKVLNEVTEDGVFKTNCLKPRNFLEYSVVFEDNIMSKWTEYSSLDIRYGVNCDENMECVFYISKNRYVKTYEDITIVWDDFNPVVREKIDFYIEKLAKIQKESSSMEYYFYLTDLNLINYFVTSNLSIFDSNALRNVTNYTDEVKKIFDNADLTYEIDARAGSDRPFNNFSFGYLIVSYNGVKYAVHDYAGIKSREVLYVPSDTELNDESLINAALKRLKEYMPNNQITITKGRSLDTYYAWNGQLIDFSEIVDLTKTTDHTYTFNFGDFTVDFLIVADSDKMSVPMFATRELDKDIMITSNDSSIPLDAMIIANFVDKDSKEYQRIKNALKKDNLYSLDLTLFSNVKNSKITKLENGVFEVKIPVPTSLEGKNLAIYYVDEDDMVEEYKVDIVDGYAVFQTNHFSIYTLTDKVNDVVNPRTGDNIVFDIILGICSFLMFTICSICLLNKRKKVLRNII